MTAGKHKPAALGDAHTAEAVPLYGLLPPSFIQTYRMVRQVQDLPLQCELLSAPEFHRIVPVGKPARGLVVTLRFVLCYQRVADIPPIGIFTLPRRFIYSVAVIIARGTGDVNCSVEPETARSVVTTAKPVAHKAGSCQSFNSFIVPVVMKITRSAMLVARSPIRSRLCAAQRRYVPRVVVAGSSIMNESSSRKIWL